jgi:diaminopimelate decarboxylase
VLHLTCVEVLRRPTGPLVVMLDAGVGLLSAYDCWRGGMRLAGSMLVDDPAATDCLVTGPSAMEEDIVLRAHLPRVPSVGERVELTRVGAYHHAGANTFFHEPPEVHIGHTWSDDGGRG